MEIQKNSRQVPKTQDICANKKYNDILYSYLQCISQWQRNERRYFLKKEVSYVKLAEKFGLSRQTVSTRFKNLKELGLIAERDKESYWLMPLDADLASLIPYETLQVLVDALNDNAISTYVYLFNRYYANGCQPFQFTLDQVKKFVGLSLTNKHNNDIITNILYILEKIGLIKYQLTTLTQPNDNFQNIKVIYQVDWMTNQLDRNVKISHLPC